MRKRNAKVSMKGIATRISNKTNDRIKARGLRENKRIKTREFSSQNKKILKTVRERNHLRVQRRELDHSKRFSLRYLILFFLSVGGIFGYFRFLSFLRGEFENRENEKKPMRESLEKEKLERFTNQWRPWKYIVIHHSGIEMGDLVRYDRYHREKYKEGLLYHFLIGNGQGNAKNGEIQIGFRWKEQKPGGHVTVEEYNQYGIGICLVGNFEVHEPSSIQMRQLGQLVLSLMKEFSIPLERVFLHREVNSTVCPGRFFPKKAFFSSIPTLST